MKSRIGNWAALITVAVTAGWTTTTALAAEKVVKVDGSSTVAPLAEAIAEEFQKANKGIKATVGTSGTGGGFKKFVRGETDISDASRPIKQSEVDDAKKNGIEFIEIPICFDALTVVVNKDNTWAESITVAELKKLWEPEAAGKVTKWNQIRPEWPDAKVELYGPGTDSGTFEYFTEAVNGKAKASRPDYTASEDDNILVKGVEGSKNAIGYFGYAYYVAHKDRLKAVKIDWDKDQVGAMEPSEENVIKGVYNPLSRPLFIYVNKKSAQTKPEVRKFVEFFIDNAGKMAKEVKYVALPDSAYEQCKSRFAKMEAGTAFGGHNEVGVSIDELMKKPLKN
ncbi:MAG: PstS family phosphate ABC transporter substrate-binding protein [Gemmataceae bacterium]|nr:PstS family phosphate ABC transporter substrate-binding protein [Gemmataceae bacterium]